VFRYRDAAAIGKVRLYEPLAKLSLRPAESPDSRQKAHFASGSYECKNVVTHIPRSLCAGG
jgi:hypothetical protein